MGYAKNTSVSVDRSQSEIKQILAKNGSEAVSIAESAECAILKFSYERKVYSFRINYPNMRSEGIVRTKQGKLRTALQAQKEIDDEKKRLWRCMLIYTKAAIEAHLNGLVKLDQALLYSMVLPTGKTVGVEMQGNLAKFEANPSYLLT